MLGVLITIFQIIFLVAIFCFLVSILVAIILFIYKNYKGDVEMNIKNNTGNYNTGNRNTGGWNTGGWNTGNCNTGNCNTGNWNTGYCNTGDWNTGDFNTGDWNTGECNTGNWNIGNCNTGNWNTGDFNTGDWNTGGWNTGYFNTITPDTILVFNKECKREEWNDAKKPTFIYFDLNVWVDEENMTEEEKQKHPEYKTTGGYLKEYEYKEAFQKSFNELNAEEKKRQVELLKALPNFDKDVFFEISGIDIDKTE